MLFSFSLLFFLSVFFSLFPLILRGTASIFYKQMWKARRRPRPAHWEREGGGEGVTRGFSGGLASGITGSLEVVGEVAPVWCGRDHMLSMFE